jgi:hypothetical protein
MSLWGISIVLAKRFKCYIEPVGIYEFKDGIVIGLLFGVMLSILALGIFWQII